MYSSATKSHRIPMHPPLPRGRAEIGVADILLSVVGVLLLGVYCLLILAGLTGEAQGVAGAPAAVGNG